MVRQWIFLQNNCKQSLFIMKKTKFRGCWGQVVCGTAKNMVQHRVLASQGSPPHWYQHLLSPFVLRANHTHLFWEFCFMGVGRIGSGKWHPDKGTVVAGAAISLPARARGDEIASIFNFKKCALWCANNLVVTKHFILVSAVPFSFHLV